MAASRVQRIAKVFYRTKQHISVPFLNLRYKDYGERTLQTVWKKDTRYFQQLRRIKLGPALAVVAFIKEEDESTFDQFQAHLSKAIAAKKKGNIAEALTVCDEVYFASLEYLKENQSHDVLSNLTPIFDRILDMYIDVGRWDKAINLLKTVLPYEDTFGMQDNYSFNEIKLKNAAIYLLLNITFPVKFSFNGLEEYIKRLENKLRELKTKDKQNFEDDETLKREILQTRVLLGKALILMIVHCFNWNLHEQILSFNNKLFEISDKFILSLIIYDLLFLVHGLLTLLYDDRDSAKKRREKVAIPMYLTLKENDESLS